MAVDEGLPIEMLAYHEAGHALAALLEGVEIADIHLTDNNGSVVYEDEESIPDRIRLDLATAGDAAVAVYEESGKSAPLRDGKDTDFDSDTAQERMRRILGQSGTDPTVEEMKAYYWERRDVMIERFSTPMNRRALRILAEQLQAGRRIVDNWDDPEKRKYWRYMPGGQALIIFRDAMRDG